MLAIVLLSVTAAEPQTETEYWRSTPARDYLDLGWGSSSQKAAAKFKDLRPKDAETWCREGNLTRDCLTFGKAGLRRVEQFLIQRVDALTPIQERLGRATRVEPRKDEVLYEWTNTLGCTLRVRQRVPSAGNSLDAMTTTLSLEWTPTTADAGMGRPE